MEELQHLMDADKSYKVYREALKAASPPGILYLGVLIRDIIYMDDTGASQLQKGHINFRKKKAVFELLQQVQQFQSKSYDIEPIPGLMDRMKNIPHAPRDPKSKEAEEQTKLLFELSLKREPRGAKRSDVL